MNGHYLILMIGIKIYLSSLRLDDLILEYEETLKRQKIKYQIKIIYVTYLKCYSQSNPVYAAVSLI